ncbi:imm11 family protein [Psychrobacter sp. FDAARGOS_221]|uniref:imm11 family protein n=1 Tax=Psychrobacter sp. FDAARGOS_221 TaxID=1975705 RepID=UPI000BB592C8|nr:DUF1629 domain-containing protein [Psychrobacter sp. FDAARGOS_221]PNK59540.1 hypothetical protein A6J60_000660 [Psychrobacter sp. FDAARGOS_221]
MIYKWFNPDMKYARYLGKNDSDESSMCWDSPILGDPLPPLSEWETPLLVQFIGNGQTKNKIISDCVSSGVQKLISQKAVDALADIWQKHATLYPVKLEDKPDTAYYMVVVHTVIDCINREQSKGMIQISGKNAGKGYFGSMTKWVFREDEIGDNCMFVLPDSATSIYVTDEFKQRVIDAGLTGFGFVKEPYDEDPFIS